MPGVFSIPYRKEPMALTAPVTNIPNLDAFLAKVATLVNTLDSKALPADGWALTDLEASVSEIIGDKRDLIDIVTKWDSAANSFAQWENLTAQQKAAIDDLKAQVESLAGSADEFEDILLWWDANYQTIFDVKAHTEVIHGDMESIHASEQAVTQMKADVTTMREEVSSDLQTTKNNKNAAVSAKTAAEEAQVAAETAEAGAEGAKAEATTQATNAAASAGTADDRANAAKTYMDTSWANRVAAIEAKDDAIEARTGAETAATNADASADASEASAIRAEEAALLADGTATAAVTARVDELLAGAPAAYDTLAEIATKLADQDGVDAALVQQIAGKVSSNGTGNKVYGTNASGADIVYPLGGSTAAANSIAYRTTGGALKVGEPTVEDHATTKKYVDDKVATAAPADHTHEIAEVDGLEEALDEKSDVGHKHLSADITDAVANIGQPAAAGKVAMTASDGFLHTNGNPTISTHVVPKGYVDSKVQVVTELPPSPDPTVLYLIPEA